MTMFNPCTKWTLLLVAVLLLSACQPAETPVPTPDADTIRTAAVLTVEAELTQQAILNPTSTATATLEPSPTPDIPTLMPLGEETPTLPAGVVPPAQATATQAPPAAPTAPDRATWVSNVPADGAVIQPGQKFEIRWTIRNTGTTTWNTNYTVRFFAGNLNPVNNTVKFRGETKPEAAAEIVVEVIAPTTPGEYYGWWKLTNAQGVNFGDVDLTIKVAGAATPTATPNP